MSKIAFVFPGQGSQGVGMGVSVAERFPEARAVFDQAGQVLGWDLLLACREGPEERLRQTDVAQPALYVTGYAAYAALRANGIQPDAVAGHSIGEYAALAAADVFGFAEGLALVKERGRLMQEAAKAHPGTMAAVLGLTVEQLKTLCQEAAGAGVCVPVNMNSPEQIVIAGERTAVEKVSVLASAQGAKRVIPLNVSGAFHSPLMKDAAQAMREKLAGMTFKDGAIPVAMNVDGKLHTGAQEIQEALGRQLDSPVEWVRTVETLKGAGCSVFVECGAGRVLSGLLRRIDKQLQSYVTETAEAVLEAAQALNTVGKGRV
jgi:[acyl-carrier-protein] S-malonyltransferase